MADQTENKALQKAQERYTKAARSLADIRNWLRNLDKYGERDTMLSLESFDTFRTTARNNLWEIKERINSMMDNGGSLEKGEIRG